MWPARGLGLGGVVITAPSTYFPLSVLAPSRLGHKSLVRKCRVDAVILLWLAVPASIVFVVAAAVFVVVKNDFLTKTDRRVGGSEDVSVSRADPL